MFSDFDTRLVRTACCGVKFNSLIADRVAELWYDNPRHARISLEQALSTSLEIDRSAEANWKEMGILRDYIVRPGDRVVECGCHHGLTTIMLAAWVGPKGFVQALDAVLFNAMVAKRNLEINGIANAAVFCAAIGGTRQVARYYNESNVVVRPDIKAPDPNSTIMVTLDDVIHDNIDVLKLDVEGCELDILEGSGRLISKIPRLAIEVHTDLLPPNGVSRVLSTLKGRPLHVLWEDGRFERYTGQPITERVHIFSY